MATLGQEGGALADQGILIRTGFGGVDRGIAPGDIALDEADWVAQALAHVGGDHRTRGSAVQTGGREGYPFTRGQASLRSWVVIP